MFCSSEGRGEGLGYFYSSTCFDSSTGALIGRNASSNSRVSSVELPEGSFFFLTGASVTIKGSRESLIFHSLDPTRVRFCFGFSFSNEFLRWV